MSKFESLTGRVFEVAGNVGDSLKKSVPDRAMKWVETGAALGAVKAGSRVAGTFVRRNPAVFVAAAAGAGLLYYLVRRHQKKQALNQPIEGKATRIEARKAAARARTVRKSSHGDETDQSGV